MNARNRTIVRVSLALISLAVCAVFATFTTSCANSDSNGGSGGTSAAAGTPAGGTPTGGTPTGGTPAASGNSVTFSAGQAQGAMTGYGWVAMGPSGDTVSDPTCDNSASGGSKTTPITGAAACNTMTNWSTTNSLCITGAIPALGTPPDYTGNWGIEIGVNANTDTAQAIGTAHTSINVGVTNPAPLLRVNVHRQGDPDTTPYCATYTGSAIPLTSFNTACWDNSGTAFTAADAPKIDKVMIQVPSGAAAVTVTNMCMTGITFN
jgi:hypothetical protein